MLGLPVPFPATPSFQLLREHCFSFVGKKIVVAATEASVTTTPETKSKRQWELWSVEDKDSFFEGLCEVQ